MALNTSPTRTDVGYLRRRVKPVPVVAAPIAAEAPAPAAPAPVESAPARPEAARPASSGLSLSPSAPAQSAPAQSAPARSAPVPTTHAPASSGLSLGPTTPPAPAARPTAPPSAPAGSLPFPAPTIDEVRELGDDAPVLRLNPRESAIGSLIVSGASSVVWEDDDLVTGAGTPDGAVTGSPVTTAGNRPLLGYDDSDAIVSLRHVRRLRRALLIGRGPEPLGVQIFDGSTVTVATGDDERMFVLALLRIGTRLELRAEPVARSATDESIHRQFGFTLTPFLVTRASRSR